MKNIAVIFGGKSSEHDISIISACSLMQNLDEKKYRIYPIYIQKNGEFLYGENLKEIETFEYDLIHGKPVCFISGKQELFVKSFLGFKPFVKIDFCFVVLHGLNGEDGSLSALLNMCEIPYSCADILPSSVAMDKVVTKYMCKALKIPVVNFVSLNKIEYFENEETMLQKISKKIGFPCIVKPARLGSSIGISRCKNLEELQNALSLAFTLDTQLIVERALINFKEYNIALFKMNNQVVLSKIEEPLGKDEILSFEDKYLGGEKLKGMESLSRIIPANLAKKQEDALKKYSQKIYKNLCFSGVVRIDFLFENEKIYLNEINSIPGSFANYLWDFSYKTLLENIMFEACEDFKQRKKLTYTFNSSVLKNVHNDGVKK